MSSPITKTRVAFSVTNCICYDQRIQKIAETVSNLDCTVTLIGRKKDSCCQDNLVPFNTVRLNMIFRKGFLFYMFFNIRLFFFLLFHSYDLLVSNDLDTLLPNFMISKLKRVPIIYDSHEYFTGVPEIQSRPFVKWVWKSIEKIIFPRLFNVMTVSDLIADRYHSEYGIRPIAVRNCSKNAELIRPFTREELGLSPDQLLVIIQGTGINSDRGCEEIIEAIALVNNVTLLVIGSGDSIDMLKGKVQKMEIGDRVIFISKLPWAELMRYTKTADVGLTVDKNTNINYTFSLPNKLFDYINAGIAVISSDLPEVRRIVDQYNCGIVIAKVTPEEIRKAFLALTNDPFKLAELKRNASLASKDLNWDNECEKVKNLYSKVLTQKFNKQV